jgi:hypothetical protein
MLLMYTGHTARTILHFATFLGDPFLATIVIIAMPAHTVRIALTHKALEACGKQRFQ